MLCAPDTDIDFLYVELNKLDITAEINDCYKAEQITALDFYSAALRKNQ